MIKKGLRSYFYGALFLLVILIILVENSYLLIKQTNTNITETSWLEAEKLINSIVASAKQSIESVQLTPQQINRHLKRISQQIDRLYIPSKDHYQDDIKEILRQYKIESVMITDAGGENVISLFKAQPSYLDFVPDDKPPQQARKSKTFQPLTKVLNLQEFSYVDLEDDFTDLRTVSFKRPHSDGEIQLVIGKEKFGEIKARIGLQLLINSLENQNVIQSATFLNDQLLIIADYEPTRLNNVEEKLEYLDSLTTGVSYFLRNDNFMEIIHPIQLTKESRGVFKISFRLPGIDQIYSNASKITIFNSVIILLAAIIAVIVVMKFHQRNLNKIESMERRISENEKLASLANLTAGVAHEIRNPLNSISITIQRLQLEFSPSKDKADYVSLTGLMKTEVDRINTIIADYLDFAKPFKPQNSDFSISEFLTDNLKRFEPEALKKQVEVIAVNHTANKQFKGDREKLTQVLTNILHNALDAAPRNGTVSVFSDIDKDHNWIIRVVDNGSGITRNNLNHIFDIYFTTKREGSGLGLYITRKIIQAHEGTIELIPNADLGVTVKIVLPKID